MSLFESNKSLLDVSLKFLKSSGKVPEKRKAAHPEGQAAEPEYNIIYLQYLILFLEHFEAREKNSS